MSLRGRDACSQALAHGRLRGRRGPRSALASVSSGAHQRSLGRRGAGGPAGRRVRASRGHARRRGVVAAHRPRRQDAGADGRRVVRQGDVRVAAVAAADVAPLRRPCHAQAARARHAGFRRPGRGAGAAGAGRVAGRHLDVGRQDDHGPTHHSRAFPSGAAGGRRQADRGRPLSRRAELRRRGCGARLRLRRRRPAVDGVSGG